MKGWTAIVLGLVLVMLLHWQQRAGPPLYDGLPLPQAPYRYVSPPPNLKSSNEPPLSGEKVLPIRDGRVSAGTVATGDNQAVAFFATGSLQAGSDAQSVKVRIEPDPSAPPAPAETVIHGNVYRIVAVGQPGGAPARVAKAFHATLRYPPGPFQELQFYDGTAWRPLPTRLDPANPYATAVLSELGEVAATAPVGAKPLSFLTVLLRMVRAYGVIAIVLAFGLVVVTQQIRRRRMRT